MRSRPLTDGVDPDDVARALREWLVSSTSWIDPEVRAIETPQSSGTGDLIWLVTIAGQFRGETATKHWVLRVQRNTSPLRDFARSFTMIEALQEVATVPVPAAIAFESRHDIFGAPFHLTSRVHGLVAPDHPPYTFESWLRDTSAERQERIWWNVVDVVASLHAVDPDDGRFAFLGSTSTPGRDRCLDTWKSMIDAATDRDRRQRLLDRWAALAESAPPPAGPDRIVWGDCRLPNVIIDGDEVAALIDFEDARLDQPEADIAMWLLQDDLYTRGLGVAALPGTPSHDATVARFEERLGRELVDLDWWTEYCRFHLSITGRLR